MSLKNVSLSRSDLGRVGLEVAGSEASPHSISPTNVKKKKRKPKMSSLTSTKFSSSSSLWCSKKIKKFRKVKMCGLPSKLKPCSSLFSHIGASSHFVLSITYTSELNSTCSSASLTVSWER